MSAAPGAGKEEWAPPSSLYETIEHDMRYSKEYLANLKFNYIELAHKELFLRKLGGAEEEGADLPGAEIKDRLCGKKKEVELVERQMEQLSREIHDENLLLCQRREALQRMAEEEAAASARIDELVRREEKLRRFNVIKKEGEEKVQRIESVVLEIEEKKRALSKLMRAISEKKQLLEAAQREKEKGKRHLELLNLRTNAKILELYSWYRNFNLVFRRLFGIQIESMKSSARQKERAMCPSPHDPILPANSEDCAIDVEVALLLREGHTFSVTLAFLDGKFAGCSACQVLGTDISSLVGYCKEINSPKFLLFELLFLLSGTPLEAR